MNLRKTLATTVATLIFVLASAATAGAQSAAGALPDLEDTGVLVPWQDFKGLLEKLQAPTPPPDEAPPPVEWAASTCTATAAVDRDEGRVEVTLDFAVEVLADDAWVDVPVIADGVALSSFRMDRAEANVFRDRGFYRVALRGAGRHVFALRYYVPVVDNRGTRSARLRFPQAPVVSLRLEVPRDRLDVTVDNAVIHAVDRGAAATTVMAAMARIQETTVSWRRQVEADDREAKVFGQLVTVVSLGEAVLRGTANASFTIHGSGVDRLRLEVPADITVLDVNAHGVKEWRVEQPDEGEDDRRILVVDLGYRATQSYSFQLSYEKLLEGTTTRVTLPDIQVLDVLRERGFIAVSAATNVEITPEGTVENASPIDPSELPATTPTPAGQTVLYAFKYLRHPVVVPLSIVKHSDVAVKRTMVERAELETFLSHGGKAITSARYTVKNNRKQYLALTLPEDAELWGAFLDDRPVKAARREDGAILVPLRKTAVGPSGELEAFTVEAVYFQPGRRLASIGRRALEAPALDVDAVEVRWTLHVPRTRRYFGFGGNLEEEAESNRILFLGGAAYNLDNAAEATRLTLEWRDGRTVVSDGINEVALDDLRLRTPSRDRPPSESDLKDIPRPGKTVATEGEESPAPSIDAAGESLRRLREERGMAQQAMPLSQVNTNVAFGAQLAGAGGGRARGVLPVRFHLPTEGLRLTFVGRLLTADEAPHISLAFVPATWRAPRVGGFWAAVLGLLLAAATAFALGRHLDNPSRRTLITTAILGGHLVLVWLFAAGHRSALLIAVMCGAGAYALLRWWFGGDRPAAGF